MRRVNDQVRKRQKRSSMNVTDYDEKHSVFWGMFMSSTLQASVFMGKNYSDNKLAFHQEYKDLTMKQMFDISQTLVSEQSDEISGVETIGWENHYWKYLSLVGDEQVISLQRTKVYVFSDSVLCLGKMNENPCANTAWEERLAWFKVHRNTETWTELMASQLNSSGIFPRIHHIAAQPQSSRVTVEIG